MTRRKPWTWIAKTTFASIRAGGEKGQAVVEYTLVILLVMGVFIAILRPELTKFMKKFTNNFSTGMFAADNTGESFYRFHVR